VSAAAPAVAEVPAPRSAWRRSALARALARVPRAAWLCALVALANGLAWSLIVPPFEVPDENAHYAYVQQVAEHLALPHHVLPEGPLSPAEDTTLGTLGFFLIVGEPLNPAPFSELQQRQIARVEAEHLSMRGDGDALSATNNPPLYYALEAVPYRLASGGSVLDRLAAMRVLSALMGALTILLVFMFVREVLPREPWAWTVGALIAAFEPLFGFMSGGVNNDNLLYLAATGILWALARSFRRGLDPVNGVLLGAFLGLGLITKLTLIAFVPGVLLAVALLVRRGWHAERRRTLVGAGWALGLGAGPIFLYAVLSRYVWHRSTVAGGVGSVPGALGRHFNQLEEISHIWQLYLPHLWQKAQFTYFPLWKTWFKGLIGRFGWLDYELPQWIYPVACVFTIAAIVLAVAMLVRRRETVRARFGELVVYALLIVGLCAEIGVQSYRTLVQVGSQFEQARYALPLIGLYGGVAALAVRSLGRRWGPVLGVALVVLAIGHDLYAQAVTVARYYT
jgi:4-amino-4-deoxy-L-arabinose transferase-like glycosyltransferase